MRATQIEFKSGDRRCVASDLSYGAEGILRKITRSHVSQPVFARYLNTSESTVQKWEAGQKKPSGMALRLLRVVEKHGLEVLV